MGEKQFCNRHFWILHIVLGRLHPARSSLPEGRWRIETAKRRPPHPNQSRNLILETESVESSGAAAGEEVKNRKGQSINELVLPFTIGYKKKMMEPIVNFNSRRNAVACEMSFKILPKSIPNPAIWSKVPFWATQMTPQTTKVRPQSDFCLRSHAPKLSQASSRPLTEAKVGQKHS